MFAFLLIQTSPGYEERVISRIRGCSELEELYETRGGWNLFCKISVVERDDAGLFVKRHVMGEGDVLETRTLFPIGDD